MVTEIERIKGNLKLITEMKTLLEEYKKNQRVIKEKTVELYRKNKELLIFKNRYSERKEEFI